MTINKNSNVFAPSPKSKGPCALSTDKGKVGAKQLQLKQLNSGITRRKLYGEKLKAYKLELSLTKVQKEVLIGTLLGDASISCRLGKPVYSVKFEQKHTQVDYINHLHLVFEPFVGTSPQMRTITNDYHKTPGQSCWFRTYSHISLKYY
jgi:hypothetical protein